MSNETDAALLDFLRETVDDLYERGRKHHQHAPEISARMALAFALSGAEWEWLQRYAAISGGRPPEEVR